MSIPGEITVTDDTQRIQVTVVDNEIDLVVTVDEIRIVVIDTGITIGTGQGLTPEQVDDRVANLIVGGTNITVTYDDPNDMLIIDGAAIGASTLSGLTDVDTSTAISDSLLAYNLGTNTWTSRQPFTAQFDLRLASRTTTDLVEGTNLYYTTARVDTRISQTSINALNDVDTVTTAPTSGDVLVWSGTEWTPLAPVTSLNALSDVNITSPVAGALLVFDQGSGQWVDTDTFSTQFDTRFATRTTSNLTEGTNLYYTTARANADFDTRFGTLTTTNLPEGTNQYFTNERVDDRVAGLLQAGNRINLTYNDSLNSLTIDSTINSTTDIPEGVNQYYTEERTQDMIALFLREGTNIDLNYNDAANTLTIGLDNTGGFNLSNNTTSDLPEGSRLYYTTARFDDRFATKTTTDLTEGSRLYYTTARFDTRFATKSTTDLTEGTNLYFTNERVDDRVANLLVAGSNIALNYNDAANTLTISTTPIDLGAGTNGNYVRSIVGTNNEVQVVGGVGEGSDITVGLPDDVTITNDLTVGGDLVVNGSTFTVNSNTVTIDDPVFTLGGDTPPVLNDGKDRGIEFRYYDTQPRIGFFGWDNSRSRLSGFRQAINNNEVFSGTIMDAEFGTVFANLTGDVTGNVTGQVSSIANFTTDDLIQGVSNLYYTTALFNADFATKTTTDLAEGTNLYYTQGRFDTAFGLKDTDDLSEGVANLYYTTARANTDFDTRLATKSTTDLAEGTNLYYTDIRFDNRFNTKTTTDLSEGTNLYFTEERVDDRVSSLISEGTNINIVYNDLTNDLNISVDSTGGFDLSNNNTDDLSEGLTNQYFTTTRARNSVSAAGDLTYNALTGEFSVTTYKSADFDVDFATKTTTDLAEGTNLYYTQGRFDIAFAAKSTTDLSEGTNLYWTQTRFDTAFGLKDTDDLSEGLTNLYFTEVRARNSLSAAGDLTYNALTGEFSFDFDALFSTKTTTDLTEGTNLYFTDERVDDRVAGLLVGGSNITLTYDDIANTLTIDNDISTLNDLTDVTITAPVDGQVVKYNGTGWVNNRLQATEVSVASRSALFNTVQDLQDVFHSTGVAEWPGMEQVGTVNTLRVFAGEGLTRASATQNDEIAFMSWIQTDITTLPLDTISWVYVDNTDTVQHSLSEPNSVVEVVLGTVFPRDLGGGIISMEINPVKSYQVGDHASLMIKRLQKTMPFVRESGGTIGFVNRNISVTAGTWWEGLNQFSTLSYDSVVTPFEYFYTDNLGNWISTDANLIDNTQYNLVGTGLASLTGPRYGVHWIYQGVSGDIYVVYGIGNYTLSEAQAVGPRPSLPPFFEGYARLLGKIIIAANSATITEVQSAFTTMFSSSGATNHGDLAGLADDDHPQYYNETRGDARYVLNQDGFAINTLLVGYREQVIGVGVFAGGIFAPDIGLNGNVFDSILLTGDIEINGFTNPLSGQSVTVVLKQDAVGGRTLTSTMKFANGVKTLSTAPNAIDMLHIYYNGTEYYATLTRNFI